MNTPQRETKVYAPVGAKEITFDSGKTILKLGINVAKFAAWLEQHKNEKGYVNLCVSSRKEVSQYGETHTVWLDTWKPDANKPSSPTRPAAQPEDDSKVPF